MCRQCQGEAAITTILNPSTVQDKMVDVSISPLLVVEDIHDEESMPGKDLAAELAAMAYAKDKGARGRMQRAPQSTPQQPAPQPASQPAPQQATQPAQVRREGGKVMIGDKLVGRVVS